MFEDREDEGKQLAAELEKYKGEDVVVIGIPRGGLPVAAWVAKALNAPLEVALTKKIGHPYNREYAIGAVSLENSILSDAVGVTRDYIREETARIREVLRERYKRYYQDREPVDLKGKTLILIDDGIATGNTVMTTAELVSIQEPKQTIVAVPVAPKSTIKKLQKSDAVDEVVCLSTPYNFHAVGQFYHYFPQTTDKEAINLLQSLREA